MRKRFKRLKKILQALNIDIGDESEATLEEIQAGIFLAQLMSQNESGDIDLTGQTGYFFKWYDGPHASNLNEDYRDLINYMRFENATNGYEISEPALVRHLERLNECVEPPSDVSRSDWMRTLAVLTYLLRAADWQRERAMEEARRILPVDERHFETAISQIDQLLDVQEDTYAVPEPA
jgi:hypothetical protein